MTRKAFPTATNRSATTLAKVDRNIVPQLSDDSQLVSDRQVAEVGNVNAHESHRLAYNEVLAVTGSANALRLGVATNGASLTLELPFANNNGQKVTPGNARLFGRDLADVISMYLQGL